MQENIQKMTLYDKFSNWENLCLKILQIDVTKKASQAAIFNIFSIFLLHS